MTPEEYWSQDARHQDQKFYAAFCLLGSACSDYAVGIDLRSEKKLNWAATALYYSLVHCGRLACFVASGDFPTGHEELKRLFETGEVQLQRNGQSWMGRSKRFLGNQDIQRQQSFRRDDLVRYFITSCQYSTDVEAQFQKWGRILSKAKNLREQQL